MKWSPFLVPLVASALALSRPANDWSRPCFNGECAYDLPRSTGQSGTLHLSGSALTDITPAAGWVILDCDPHALQQEVRLVCSTHDLESTGCQHVFANGGPVDRVVRLPESCSAAPFLRVASARVSDDQSVPSELANKVARRDGATPIVHVFRLDANWAAVDVSKTGIVNLTFSASNFPESEVQARDTDFELPSWVTHPIDAAKSAVTTVVEHVQGVPNAVQSAAETVKNTVGSVVDKIIEADKTQKENDAKSLDAVVNKVHSVYDDVTTKVGGAIDSVVDSLHQGTSFSYHPEISEQVHFDRDKDITIISSLPSGFIGCSQNLFKPSLQVFARGKIDAVANVDFTIKGSLIPPKLTDHSVHGIINADADVHITVNATLAGHIESPRKQLAHIPLTPYQIPGIAAVGPIVSFETQVGLDPELSVAFETRVRGHVRELEFWYPIQHRGVAAKSIDFKPLEFDLSVSPNISAQMAFTGHLIPSLELGVTFLSGLSEFVAVGEADIHVKATVRGEAISGNQRRSPRRINPTQLASRDADVQFRGCLALDAGVVLRGGLKADALGYNITTRSWDFYQFPTLSIYHVSQKFSRCWTTDNLRKRSENSQLELFKDVQAAELPFSNCMSKSKQPKRVGKVDKFEKDFYPLVPPNP